MKIADIKACEQNERDHSTGIEELMASIEDAGFRGTIALRSHDDPTIVAGHGRVEALKRLGWTEIPDEQVEWLDELTDEQVERYRINDNKTGELSRWNRSALRETVRRIEANGVDMSKFGFDFKSKKKFYGAERLRTDTHYNLDICRASDCEKDGWPHIPAVDVVPKKLIGFNYALSTPNKDKATIALHFYIDDYQFERIWNAPHKYVEELKRYQCVIMPDFSLYTDMPEIMQKWNLYRSLALSHWWTELGIEVVPSLTWSTPESYKWSFKAIPRGSTVALSTVGCAKDPSVRKAFNDGLRKALEVVKPARILVYGSTEKLNIDDIEVCSYAPHIFEGN